MTNVGYATLSIIPSMQGFSSLVEREMAPQLAKAGRTAGVTAGREVGKGISTGVREHAPTSSSVFQNVEKGAAVAGVGAGRRFGTALKETVGEYGKTIGATMVGFFAYEKVKEFIGGVIEESRKAAANERITAAIIKSTGEAAHVTAEQVGELTDALSKKTGIDKEQIAASENVLLTFKGVRNEIGKGNDVFNQASQAILDISTVMAGSGGSDGGNSFSGAARQLGKALNDPVKGLTALTRVGVTFSQQQKDQIKGLVGSGHLLDAQKIILHEIQSEYGGAAAASGDAVSKMSANFKVFEAELGQKVLPFVEGLASTVTGDVIPALKAGTDGVIEAARGWSELPQPIKTATEAWIAYTIAQKVGFTGMVAGRITAMGSAFDSLRLRLMLTKDAYMAAREGEVLMTNGLVTGMVPGVGRAESALAGLRAGAVGAGAGIKAGLSGALGLVGGPWGAAFIGATLVVTHFWEAHQKAKQEISDLTKTLDEQTGAVTRNTREWVVNKMQDEGLLQKARDLGLNLSQFTDAALGKKNALAAINRELALADAAGTVGAPGSMSKAAKESEALSTALNGTNSDLSKARQGALLHAAAMGKAADATRRAAGATREDGTATRPVSQAFETYATRIDKARTAIDKLRNAENKRRLQNLQDKQDRLSLIEQMQAAAQAYKDNGRTLDENTKKGQANNQALIDLANQWDNSSKKVHNSKGMYDRVEKTFIGLAEKMGATSDQAKRMAREDLFQPKGLKGHVDVRTKGMLEALDGLRKLREEAKKDQALRAAVAVSVSSHQAGNPMLAGARALGGPVVKGQTYLVGENGPELYTATGNGNITPNSKLGRGGINIEQQHLHGIDPWQWKRDHEHMIRAEAMGAVDFS